jgi:hypothetical protein
MKKSILLYATAVSLVVLALFFISFPSLDVRAQKAASTSLAVIEPPASSPLPKAGGRFAAAAAENARSQYSLRWDFAGKPQTGWALYAQLISSTVGTDDEAGSAVFAQAVSRWQGTAGLPANGIIDAETLKGFIAQWQAKRFSTPASSGEPVLTLIPAEECYDITRDAELRKLQSETYQAYKRMIAAAAKELGPGVVSPTSKYLTIVSGYRSPEYQESLRKKEPGAGRGALAKTSVHSTGRAIDMYVGGEPVTTKDENRALQVQTPVYKWLVKNAAKFGFVPYFYEPWHWEYVGASAP